MTLNVLDLCCGAGMASVGLAEAGCRIVGGVDIWAEAQRVLAAQFDVEAALADFDDGDDVGGVVDVVITGPPCQDDSLANHGPDRGRGDVKRWALSCAQAYDPTWIVMEMVSRQWLPWCRENGARQTFQLCDHELGGFTQRKRWFAVWGPADLKVKAWREPQGWGKALLCADQGAVLAAEANSKTKRWHRAKAPHEAAPAVTGGGRAFLLRRSSGEVTRLGPREAAALSGWPLMRLGRELSARELNTMIGNGWPRAFGLCLGRALLAAHKGEQLALPI